MIDHSLERLGRSLEDYLEALGCDCSAVLSVAWNEYGHVQIDVVHEPDCLVERRLSGCL